MSKRASALMKKASGGWRRIVRGESNLFLVVKK